jgi:hypothetical protein
MEKGVWEAVLTFIYLFAHNVVVSVELIEMIAKRQRKFPKYVWKNKQT